MSRAVGCGNSRDSTIITRGAGGGTQRERWEGKGHKHERALTECPARPGRAERGTQPERLRAAAFAGGGDPRPAAADAVDGWRDDGRGDAERRRSTEAEEHNRG